MARKSNKNDNISSKDVDITSIIDSIRESSKNQKDLAEGTAKVQQDLAEDSISYTKEMTKVGWEGIKDSSKQAMNTISGHSKEVLGSGLTEMYDLSKGMLSSLGGGIKKMWDIRQEKKKDKSEEFLEDISDSQEEFTSAALSKGSIYTHDITLEGVMGDVTKLLETQQQSIFNMENMANEGQKFELDNKRLMTKSMDMLYGKGGEKEEDSGIDILQIAVNIFNTLSGQAEDIKLMRINQVEQMGFLTKFIQPMREFYARSVRNIAKGSDLVANRVTEVRKILSKSLNVSEKDVAIRDKSWKLLPKLLLSPILLPLWGIKKVFGSKQKEELSDNEKRNALLFDILKSVSKLPEDNKNMIEMIRAPKGGIDIDGKKYKGGQFLPKDMTKAMIGADKKDKDDEMQTNLLSGINGYFLRKEKEDDRNIKDPTKKFPWMVAIFALGAAIGGIAGAILLPFTLLYKAIKSTIKVFSNIWGLIKKVKIVGIVLTKLSVWFSSFGEWIKKLPVIGKIMGFMGKVGTFFGKIGSFFSWIGGQGTRLITFLDRFSVFKVFFVGLRQGFKYLAWPFRLIMMVVDFVKGFISTEGNIIDKIKGGLMSVVVGFIEMPVKLLGWVVDWFLNLIGVKGPEGGTAKLLMDNIMSGVSTALDIIMWPFRKIYNWITSIFSKKEEKKEDKELVTLGEKFSGLGQKIKDWIWNKFPILKAAAEGNLWEYIKTNWLGGGESSPDTSKILQTLESKENTKLKEAQELYDLQNKMMADDIMKVQEIKDRIKKSESGQDMYGIFSKQDPILGRESVGREKDIEEIKKLNEKIENQMKIAEDQKKIIGDLKDQATTHKSGHSLFVNVVNWDELIGSSNVKKAGGKIESAEADKAKVTQDILIDKRNRDQQRLEEQQKQTEVMKKSSIKADKYQSEMNKSGSNMVIAGSGGNREVVDIPEEIDNYLLGLAVAGVLS